MTRLVLLLACCLTLVADDKEFKYSIDCEEESMLIIPAPDTADLKASLNTLRRAVRHITGIQEVYALKRGESTSPAIFIRLSKYDVWKWETPKDIRQRMIDSISKEFARKHILAKDVSPNWCDLKDPITFTVSQ